jgi:hypothetical protein
MKTCGKIRYSIPKNAMQAHPPHINNTDNENYRIVIINPYSTSISIKI